MTSKMHYISQKSHPLLVAAYCTQVGENVGAQFEPALRGEAAEEQDHCKWAASITRGGDTSTVCYTDNKIAQLSVYLHWALIDVKAPLLKTYVFAPLRKHLLGRHLGRRLTILMLL